MKTIEITIQPDGSTEVQTKGFTGPTCKQASKFLETALGKVVQDKNTAEYYQQAGNSIQQRLGQ